MYAFQEFTWEWYQEVMQDTRLCHPIEHSDHCPFVSSNIHHDWSGWRYRPGKLAAQEDPQCFADLEQCNAG